MHVSVPSDSGNAEVLDLGAEVATIRVRPDAGSSYRQWFHLRVSGVPPQGGRLRVVEAGACSYPRGFHDYSAVVSADRVRWARASTTFDDQTLTIALPPGVSWVATFAPYPLERHRDLVARCSGRGWVRRLGATLDGEDLDVVEVGTGPKPIWILARQHPGEPMAEWFAEGLLDHLLAGEDPLVAHLLERVTLRVVPNMNPDGTRRGHLRANAAGVDLNRAWAEADPERAPEVAAVRGAMDVHGVSLCLDIHGDEVLPWVFAAGAGGTPSWDAPRARLHAAFLQRWCEAAPDFQTAHGYRPNAPGEANLQLCTNQVAERYGALAMTIEQPFKDNAGRPDPELGWSPARCQALGRSVLHPILHILDGLP